MSRFNGKPTHFFETGRQSVVTVSCNMTHLQQYPFDTYECNFHIVNLDGNLKDKVILQPACKRWRDCRRINKTGQEFFFEFTEQKTETLHSDYKAIVVTCHITRTRRTKVLVYYAVTTMIAFLSLISFFVEKDNVPGRLSTLVTLYLLIVTTYRGFESPKKIGYGNIEEWFIIIQVPVLVAIIEYGCVLIWRKYASIVGFQLWHKNGLKIIDLATFTFVLIYLMGAVVYVYSKFS